MRGKRDSDPADVAVARLADAQYGVVARRQLVALGVDRHALERRIARRVLVRLHRGVYAFGHRRLRIEGRWLAAVLAAGEGAVLSHRDAAALHGMRAAPASQRVCVTSPASPRRVEGLWLFARRILHDEDVAAVRAVPVTSPARTLVDLAPMLTAAQLQGTLGEADRRGLLDVDAVEAALYRLRGRRGQGHARLKAALDTHVRHGATLLRSELEARVLDLVVAADLPRPALNAPAAGFEVDALWARERVVVEVDGWAHHKERAAAAQDREKTNRLQTAGYLVLRFLHGDVAYRPGHVAAAIERALAQAAIR